MPKVSKTTKLVQETFQEQVADLMTENKNLRNHIALLKNEQVDRQNEIDILNHNIKQLDTALNLAKTMIQLSVSPRLAYRQDTDRTKGEDNGY